MFIVEYGVEYGVDTYKSLQKKVPTNRNDLYFLLKSLILTHVIFFWKIIMFWKILVPIVVSK